MICFPKGKPPSILIIIIFAVFIGQEVNSAPADPSYTNKSSSINHGECSCGVDQKIYFEKTAPPPMVHFKTGLFSECNALGVTLCYHRCRNETFSLVKKLCENKGHVVNMEGYLFYYFCTAPRWQNIGRVKHVAQICCHNNKPIDCNKMKAKQKTSDSRNVERTLKIRASPTYSSSHLQDKNVLHQSYLDNIQGLEITKYLIKNSTFTTDTPHTSLVPPSSQEINNKNNGSSTDNKHERQTVTKVSFRQTRSVAKENNLKLQLNNLSQVNETVTENPRTVSINVTMQKKETDKNITNPQGETGLKENISTLHTTEKNTSFGKLHPVLMDNKNNTLNKTQNKRNSKMSDSKLFKTDSMKDVSRKERLETPSCKFSFIKREAEKNNEKLKNITTSQNETHEVPKNASISEEEKEGKILNKSKLNITDELTLSKRKCSVNCNFNKNQETVPDNNNSGVAISVKVHRSIYNKSLQQNEKFESSIKNREKIASSNTTKPRTNIKHFPESILLEHNKKHINSRNERDTVTSDNTTVAETILKQNHKLNESLYTETNRSDHNLKMTRDTSNKNTTENPVIKEHILTKSHLLRIKKIYNSSKDGNKTDFSASHNKSLDTGVISKQEIIKNLTQETYNKVSDFTSKQNISLINSNKTGTVETAHILLNAEESHPKKEFDSPNKETLPLANKTIPVSITIQKIASSGLKYDSYLNPDEEYAISRKVRDEESLINQHVNLTTNMNNQTLSRTKHSEINQQQSSTKKENGSLVNVSTDSTKIHDKAKNLTDTSVNKTVEDNTNKIGIKDHNLQNSTYIDSNQNQSGVRNIRNARQLINITINNSSKLDEKIPKDAPTELNNTRYLREIILTGNSTKIPNEVKEEHKIKENSQPQPSLSLINYTKPSGLIMEEFKSQENENTEPSKEHGNERKIRDISVNNTSETISKKIDHVNESEQLDPSKKENDTRKMQGTLLPVQKQHDQKSSGLLI